MRRRFAPYLILYFVWLLALWALPQGPAESFAWFDNWIKWDAHWYEKIWSIGYKGENIISLVFPPAYAYTVGIFSKISFLNFHHAAIAVNVIAFFFGIRFASEVLARRLRVNPLLIFLFGLSSPASYFVLSAYSDSVFLLILWAAVYTALFINGRRGLVIESVLLLIAPWFRLTGYALFSWILLRRWSALSILVSLAGWFLLNDYLTGEWNYFLETQKKFVMPEGDFIEGARLAFSGLLPLKLDQPAEVLNPYLQFNLLPTIYFVSLIVTGFYLAVRKEWLLSLTLFSILAISHNQSFWRSVVRYDLPLAPILGGVILLEYERIRPRFIGNLLFGFIIGVQFFLQIYFAQLFKAGQWAF
jgi:hypothetical protein